LQERQGKARLIGRQGKGRPSLSHIIKNSY
jgi:hypothetical protein